MIKIAKKILKSAGGGLLFLVFFALFAMILGSSFYFTNMIILLLAYGITGLIAGHNEERPYYIGLMAALALLFINVTFDLLFFGLNLSIASLIAVAFCLGASLLGAWIANRFLSDTNFP